MSLVQLSTSCIAYNARVGAINGSRLLAGCTVGLVLLLARCPSDATTISSLDEVGRGRKCVVLVGRPRDVYNMTWNQLEQAGGFGVSEHWAKVSTDGGGMLLFVTEGVESTLGHSTAELSMFFTSLPLSPVY